MLSPAQVQAIIRELEKDPSARLMSVMTTVVGEELARQVGNLVYEYLDEQKMFRCDACRCWQRRGSSKRTSMLCARCHHAEGSTGVLEMPPPELPKYGVLDAESEGCGAGCSALFLGRGIQPRGGE